MVGKIVGVPFLDIIIVALLIGSFAGVAFGLAARLGRKNVGPSLISCVLVSIPVVMVAYIGGYMAGVAGSAAIGNLLPAVLALIGAFNVYLFGARTRNRPMSIYAIFLFAIILFYGINEGLYVNREGPYTEDYLATRADHMRKISNFELEIKNYRSNLGLQPDPPDWVTDGQ
jgi:hypothetical protein